MAAFRNLTLMRRCVVKLGTDMSVLANQCCSSQHKSLFNPYFLCKLGKIFSTSAPKHLREIVQTTDGATTTVEGKCMKSVREDSVVTLQQIPGTCPLCEIDVKYTDVLILSQFVRADGCVLSSRLTGLCRKKQKHLAKLVQQAQRAGLMPNLRPDKRDGRERMTIMSPYKWKRYNVYYDDKFSSRYRI